MIIARNAKRQSPSKRNSKISIRPGRSSWPDEEAWLAIASRESGLVEQPPILLAGRYHPDQQDVLAALEAAHQALTDRFVIIERSPKRFMQCLCQGDHWLLEKLEGGEDAHYCAMVNTSGASAMLGGPAIEDGDLMSRIFSKRPQLTHALNFALTCDAMQRYFTGKPDPHWLQWERIEIW